ncbi:hypothetical protein GM3709_1025 [Geminocystis sp. NIES-3709]|nr:hypothetical protein GM3709_1025 [Geminocystis sp. NIES-3709]
MKNQLIVLTLICIIISGITIFFMGGIDPQLLNNILTKLGIFAPIIYIFLYILATILLVPSTPLNLSGGLIFGFWWGLLWTSIGAIIAGVVSFAYARYLGRNWVKKRFGIHLQKLDKEIKKGGMGYIFAIRLLPLIPYGIVNFSAGLTSVKEKDYFFGTIFGTIPGILPFVMMGAGFSSISKGDMLTMTISLGLIGLLVGIATWYKKKNT